MLVAMLVATLLLPTNVGFNTPSGYLLFRWRSVGRKHAPTKLSYTYLRYTEHGDPSMEPTGRLGLIMGPMYAGKTSALLSIYRSWIEKGGQPSEVLCINFVGDTRYDKEGAIVSHDGARIAAIAVSELGQVCALAERAPEQSGSFAKAKLVLINEIQFFPDAVAWVTAAVEEHCKEVYVCGLDCDFQRKPFRAVGGRNWLDLVPIADQVTKLHADCALCASTSALFSYRLSPSTEQVLIGSTEYQPLCRQCYRNKHIKST